MRVLARRMIFLGNDHSVAMVDNSPCMICARRALRRLACEGRRSGSSHGESVRLTSCPPLRPHAHSSTSVCIQRFKLYTARFVQMLRTCCCPEPHNEARELQIVLVVVADTGCPQPSRYGAATVGEQNARQQYRQPPAIASVQPCSKPLAPFRPLFGPHLPKKNRPNDISNSPSLAPPLCGCVKNCSMMEEPFFVEINF